MDFDQAAPMDRRRFLTLSGSTAVASGIVGTAPILFPRQVRAASHATQEWTLRVTRPEDRVFQYNGKTTGPIMKVNAGETFVVNVINDMPFDDMACPEEGKHNETHGMNVTNLHTHGLHVAPNKNPDGTDSDNIFLRIFPKDQGSETCGDEETVRIGENTYHFVLPGDHPPGTHWYHAHKHGSTARQVIGGLAGPLIVRDPEGWMPDYIADAPERILMISGRKVIEVAEEGGGQVDHTIRLAPGAVERWRIINAEAFGTSFFNIDTTSDDVELWQIAFDGLTLKKRIRLEGSNKDQPWTSPGILAPGNRMDVMIRVKHTAPEGALELTAAVPELRFLHAHSDGLVAADASDAKISIEVAGPPDPKPWDASDDLPGPMLDDITQEPDEHRVAHFDVIGNRFEIEGKVFGEDKTPLYQLPIDTVDQWTLTNGPDGMHPFHIHVNPFFVTHVNGQLPEDSPLRRWQDTIAIPPSGFVKFLTHYKDFKGKFVIHCHILFHEDAGMMRVVEVV